MTSESRRRRTVLVVTAAIVAGALGGWLLWSHLPRPNHSRPATVGRGGEVSTSGLKTGSRPAVGDVLAANAGGWTQVVASYDYQWHACKLASRVCRKIPGAEAHVYTVKPRDVGYRLGVTVTAFFAAGGSASRASAPTSVVTSGFTCPKAVRCFYIAANGSDSNRGTSESGPWAHAPGMQTFGKGCSGECTTYVHRPGDEFIFRGGDTWGNANFPMYTASGNASHDDYYGVDPSWYSGARWAQPTFSGEKTDICPSGCKDPNVPGGSTSGIIDVVIDASGQDYVEFDDLHLMDFSAMTARPYHTCAELLLDNDGNAEDEHITVNRLTIDNVSIGAWAEGFGSTSGDVSLCAPVLFYSGPPYGGSSIVENSTIIGDGDTYGRVLLQVPNAVNNTISGFPEGLIYPAGSGTIAGNKLSYCAVNPSTGRAQAPSAGGKPASPVHSNAIEVLGVSGTDTFYIHDNVIHDTGGPPGGGCESIITYGGSGEVDYVYNNVLYNLGGNSLHVDQGHDPTAYYAWNNSISGGVGGTQDCFLQAHGGSETKVYIQNNLCITKGSAAVDPSIGGSTRVITGNVLVTPAQVTTGAHAGDFALPGGSNPFVWEPLNNATPAAGAGPNLTSFCRGSLGGLCSDTSYAGERTSLSRPSGGNRWDVGAYQIP